MSSGKINHRKNLNDILQAEYSFYKDVRAAKKSNNKVTYKIAMTSALSKLLAIPMWENAMNVMEEITPTDKPNDPIWFSLVVLVVSIFIGYMIFRIIVMRLFDRKSLKPNPSMSQTDLDKLNVKVKNAEQLAASNVALSHIVKKLEKLTEYQNQTIEELRKAAKDKNGGDSPKSPTDEEEK